MTADLNVQSDTHYFQVAPSINGSLFFNATQFGIGTDTSNGNASISGGFIVYQSATAPVDLQFILSTGITEDIFITGIISIFPIAIATV